MYLVIILLFSILIKLGIYDLSFFNSIESFVWLFSIMIVISEAFEIALIIYSFLFINSSSQFL